MLHGNKLNAAIDWAVEQDMDVVYMKHNNLSPGTRTFKPDTKGAELVPELRIVSNKVFVKTKANALTSEGFSAYIRGNGQRHPLYLDGIQVRLPIIMTENVIEIKPMGFRPSEHPIPACVDDEPFGIQMECSL